MNGRIFPSEGRIAPSICTSGLNSSCVFTPEASQVYGVVISAECISPGTHQFLPFHAEASGWIGLHDP